MPKQQTNQQQQNPLEILGQLIAQATQTAGQGAQTVLQGMNTLNANPVTSTAQNMAVGSLLPPVAAQQMAGQATTAMGQMPPQIGQIAYDVAMAERKNRLALQAKQASDMELDNYITINDPTLNKTEGTSTNSSKTSEKTDGEPNLMTKIANALMAGGMGLQGKDPTATLANIQALAGQTPLQAGQREQALLNMIQTLPENMIEKTKAAASSIKPLMESRSVLEKATGQRTPEVLQARAQAVSGLGGMGTALQLKIDKITEMHNAKVKSAAPKKGNFGNVTWEMIK